MITPEAAVQSSDEVLHVKASSLKFIKFSCAAATYGIFADVVEDWTTTKVHNISTDVKLKKAYTAIYCRQVFSFCFLITKTWCLVLAQNLADDRNVIGKTPHMMHRSGGFVRNAPLVQVLTCQQTLGLCDMELKTTAAIPHGVTKHPSPSAKYWTSSRVLCECKYVQ